MTSSRPRATASPDSARTTVHARFIPREELNSFSAWTPGHLDGGPAPQSSVRRAAAAEEAPPPTAPAPPEPPPPDPAAVTAELVRAARQGGYQDGYRDGLVALEGFKQSFAAQMAAQIGALVVSLDRELEGLQHEMARTLATCATQLARHVVRHELSAEPALVATVAQEALDTLLLSARHITLRVHPDDHALVLQGTAEVLQARGARLVADAAMARGGCVVESDIGSVDASLETRWRRAAAALGSTAAWEPGDASSARDAAS